MTSANAALRAAVHDALAANSALHAALGGARVYDEPPRGALLPYISVGEARITDASVDDGPTQEHQITLHARSRQGGQGEAHAIAGAVLQALDDAPLTLTGHRLVNFRFAVADIRRESDGRTYHAQVRFRAVTEPTT
ncbi:MAG: DUF3168 domain-containing protein [Nitrobacter sp.]